MIQSLLHYAGQAKRRGDLFSNKSLWNAAANRLQKGLFKGVENVYTQHTSVLKSHVDNLLKGKLREDEFPSYFYTKILQAVGNVRRGFWGTKTETNGSDHICGGRLYV